MVLFISSASVLPGSLQQGAEELDWDEAGAPLAPGQDQSQGALCQKIRQRGRRSRAAPACGHRIFP